MTTYLIMLVVSVFFASCARRLQYETEYRKAYYVYGILSVLPFLMVSSIRYRVGTDWPIYDEYFHAEPPLTLIINYNHILHSYLT